MLILLKVNHFTRYGIQEQFISDKTEMQQRKQLVRQELYENENIAEIIAAKLAQKDVDFEQVYDVKK